MKERQATEGQQKTKILGILLRIFFLFINKVPGTIVGNREKRKISLDFFRVLAKVPGTFKKKGGQKCHENQEYMLKMSYTSLRRKVMKTVIYSVTQGISGPILSL
jgi:hypothetical protein